MKRIIGLVVVILTLISFQPAYGFDLTEQFDQMQQFTNTDLKKTGSVIVEDAMTATSSEISSVRVLKTFNVAPGQTMSGTWADCVDLTEAASDQFCGKPNVLKDDFSLQGTIIAPQCGGSVLAPCIKSLLISQNGSAFIGAKFSKYSHQGLALAGNQPEPELGLPAGASSSLFSVDLPGWSGIAVAVKPIFEYRLTASSSNPKKFTPKAFSLEVAPVIYSNVPSSNFVSFTKGSRAYGFGDQKAWPEGYPLLPQTNSFSAKLWSESGRMAKKANLPDGVRIRVVMQMPLGIPNWYFGQVENASTKFAAMDAVNVVEFEAEPATVQQIAFASTLAKMPSSLPNAAQQPFTNVVMMPGNGFSISDFLELLPEKVDSSLGVERTWRIGAGAASGFSESEGSNQLNKCLAKFPSFGGMVTTNAPLFDSDMPKYINGYLDYKVSGLHFGPDGKTPNTGTYTLAVPSALARCVYGLSNLPISASISVFGEGGETRVATTTVNESADGILTVSAKGFTFSSPTVRVKFLQGPKLSKLTKITCVKGKVVKVVTGPSAKCPSGFKKK